jgi:hypothetical protein
MTSLEISTAELNVIDGQYHRKASLTSADVEIVPRIGETLKLDLNDSTNNYLVVGVVHEIAYDRGRNTVQIDLLVRKVV